MAVEFALEEEAVDGVYAAGRGQAVAGFAFDVWDRSGPVWSLPWVRPGAVAAMGRPLYARGVIARGERFRHVDVR